MDYTSKYCIVGTGSSGLAAAKNLKAHHIPFDVIEAEDEVGGNWYYGKPRSSVYRSTHLISSKPLTEYTDFPMPAHYPDYPGHAQVWEYLRSYARVFGLYESITFNTAVEKIAPAAEHWEVTLSNQQTRRYRGVIIANGHNWDPKYPNYPGPFNGVTLHSAQYKTPEVLRDKRVLVVGAGNSGCDIAVESAQNAAKTFHSVRRGYYYVPKYFFGKPADQIGEVSLKLRVPLPVRRAINNLLLKMVVGTPQKFGLPKPDHKLFETHPIVNSQMLYLNIFHPEYDNLFVAGLIQPDSGQWGLVDYQTQLIAKFILAQTQNPVKADKFRRLKAGPQPNLSHGIKYLDSTRHYVEIEHFSYRQRLQKLIKKMA